MARDVQSRLLRDADRNIKGDRVYASHGCINKIFNNKYGKTNLNSKLQNLAFSLSACDCFEGKYELIGLYGMDECSAECGEGRRRNVII